MKRVLIVDDEIAVATVFETTLKGAGYDVKMASDAKTGISTAKSEKFDLILMDQMMPDMSGNEALKTLKADPSTSSVPVAMLTNFGHDVMVKEALNSNAVDYILKYQVSNDALVSRVKSIIGEAGAPSTVGTQEASQQPAAQPGQADGIQQPTNSSPSPNLNSAPEETGNK